MGQNMAKLERFSMPLARFKPDKPEPALPPLLSKILDARFYTSPCHVMNLVKPLGKCN
jgi:hypothetical protein